MRRHLASFSTGDLPLGSSARKVSSVLTSLALRSALLSCPALARSLRAGALDRSEKWEWLFFAAKWNARAFPPQKHFYFQMGRTRACGRTFSFHPTYGVRRSCRAARTHAMSRESRVILRETMPRLVEEKKKQAQTDPSITWRKKRHVMFVAFSRPFADY